MASNDLQKLVDTSDEVNKVVERLKTLDEKVQATLQSARGFAVDVEEQSTKALQAIQFQDMGSQIIQAVKRRSRDAAETLQQVSQGPMEERDLPQLLRHLADLIDDQSARRKKAFHMPVQQTSIEQGDVVLF